MKAIAKVSKNNNQESSVFSGHFHAKEEASEKQVKQNTAAYAGRGFNASQISIMPSSSGIVQPKLKINAPNDKYEQEADWVADQIVRMPDNSSLNSINSLTRQESIQQKPLVNEISAISTKIQRKCSECEEEEIQTKANGNTLQTANSSLSRRIQNSRGKGEAMNGRTQSFMSSRFGTNFSDVRIHIGSSAIQMNKEINAMAFTTGRDIYFNQGAYNPRTKSGNKLIAHELTHVIQQRKRQPTIQRLSVTQYKKDKKTCGGRNVQWVFSLDKKAPEDGYIVQQVDMSEYVSNCPSEAIGPAAPRPTFWEAWFVKKEEKVDWTTVRDKWTDGSTGSPRPNTNGTYNALGEIKFFKKSITGDLGDFGKAPTDPKSPWGPGKVSTSGSLPSTPNKPSWWSNAPTEGPANRGVWSNWNCCDSDISKHTYDLKTKP